MLPPIEIYLSPPDVGPRERELLLDAFDSNWIAPLGPHVDAFEAELAAYVGAEHAVALSSGTAALHLALLLHGVGQGDEVLCQSMTFVATANAITLAGATPVFVDSETATWNLDPELVVAELEQRAAEDRLPAAIVTVDLYGQCADHGPIMKLAHRLGVPVVEDAAEALGATWQDRGAGRLGDIGVFSFNGNKIMTTSGGGALVTDDADLAARARFLATQARDPALHYEHSSAGFNYRMSNLLAAVGRGQLEDLDRKIARRRDVRARYEKALGDIDGLSFMPHDPRGEPNHWLTCLQLDPEVVTPSPADVCDALRQRGIEARPLWKPMHLQPLFADAPVLGGGVADEIFARGVCLPSGSSLTDGEIECVADAVRAAVDRAVIIYSPE